MIEVKKVYLDSKFSDPENIDENFVVAGNVAGRLVAAFHNGGDDDVFVIFDGEKYVQSTTSAYAVYGDRNYVLGYILRYKFKNLLNLGYSKDEIIALLDSVLEEQKDSNGYLR